MHFRNFSSTRYFRLVAREFVHDKNYWYLYNLLKFDILWQILDDFANLFDKSQMILLNGIFENQ
jgi:hypothetical protein